MSEDALGNFGKSPDGLFLEEHSLVNKVSLLFDQKVYVTPLHRGRRPTSLCWVSCLCCLELLPLHVSGRDVISTRAAVLR